MPRPQEQIGPYTLIRRLGKGGFGEVWLAEEQDAIMASQVALKILIGEDPDLEAVKQEAAVWIQASGHPNVLLIIKAAQYGEDLVIVSEYAPDGSLKDWLHRHGGKAPSIKEAIHITNGILAGLEHLHARRIIHRDIKPDNVLMQGETPRLADFGISRVMQSTAHSQMMAGTPAYMAPEAFKRERDEQTDIWAVGVLLYQMVSGRLPFVQKDLFLLMDEISNQEPPEIASGVPEPMRRVIATALQKEQATRYKTAREMREALQEARRLIEEAERYQTRRESPPANQATIPTVRGYDKVPEVLTETIALFKLEAERLYKHGRYAEAIAKWQETLRLAPNEASVEKHIQEAEQRLNEANHEREKKPKEEASQQSTLPTKVRPPKPNPVALIQPQQFAATAPPSPIQPILPPPATVISSAKKTSRLPLIGGVSLLLLIIVIVLAVLSKKPVERYTETVNGVPIEMVGVPGGTFTMGSPNSETGRDECEGPQHQVTLSSYVMGKYEVTQAQWKAVAQLPKVKIDLKANPSGFTGDTLPVDSVSWIDAEEFCERLSNATGKKYRLPTEAEWEYACRAGSTGPFAGNLDELAWYSENSGDKTHPVGTKKANAWGLYDMLGNVGEWCMDWFDDKYYSQSPSIDPTGPNNGLTAVVRPSSYGSGARSCRSSFRFGLTRSLGNTYGGFRVSRTYP